MDQRRILVDVIMSDRIPQNVGMSSAAECRKTMNKGALEFWARKSRTKASR
jgi:hypothetical protein